MRKVKKGFTLIELIAVVAIIAILAAVILPQVFGQIRKGRVSRNLSEAEDLRKGTLEYFADVGAWPVDPADGTDNAIQQLLSNPLGALNWKGPYMDKAPRRNATPRYVDQYGGCFMLNDIDSGGGDDSDPDRNGDGITRDRFVYFGAVPAREANETDIAVDGESAAGQGTPTTGAVIQLNTVNDPCSTADDGDPGGTDWRTDPADTPSTMIHIFSSGT